MSSHFPSDERTNLLGAALLIAFHQLAEDSFHAPTPRQKLALAELAAEEITVLKTLPPFIDAPIVRRADAAVADFYRRTQPQDWHERLVKTYVSFNLVQDFLRAIIADDESVGDAARAHLSSSAHVDFVQEELRPALHDDQQLTARLSLWGRRVMGETIAVVRHLIDAEPSVLPGDSAATMTELTRAHSQRMSALGLAP